LFEFAIGRDFCKLNPVKPIATVNIRKGKPPVFTVEQMRKLLHTAAQFVPDEYIIESRSPLRGSLQPVKDAAKIVKAREQLVPYIALGLFAGLRPESELQKLDWSAIQFEADYPYIRAKGKTGERDVTMSANLIEWLAPYRRVSGKIGYSKKRLAAVVAAAGLTWSPDVMRHSFGSYHLAHHRNITETAHQMGNSTKMVKDHYENVRTAKEATEYFATVPENKVIGLISTPAFARAAG
jgi:integrase